MLASGILILVVASVVSLSRFVIKGYAVTISRTQALYLAQEGQEIVRDIRDTYWIDGNPDTDFTNLFNFNGPYFANWNPVTGSWVLLAGSETIPPGTLGPYQLIQFERIIQFSDVDLGDSRLNSEVRRVTVTVSWTEGGKSWDVTTETFLTNWKPEA